MVRAKHNDERIERLQEVITQLRTCHGFMTQLARDDQGQLALDWVEVVPRLLASPDRLDAIENEARALWQRGIRYVVWCGMGGSGTIVKALLQFGFCQQQQGIMLHILDSTDPAALNTLLLALASQKGIPLDSAHLHCLLQDVLLIAVSMSNTSEESLSHTLWFLDLLRQAQLSLSNHVLIMSGPQARLSFVAQEHAIPCLSLFVDETFTGFVGRFSAPGTRIFLLPVALHFAHYEERGQLRAILQQAWHWHNLAGAERDPASHPFVQLAVRLFQTQHDGSCRLFLSLPSGFGALHTWIEQLIEQSLCKVEKGIVVFDASCFQPIHKPYDVHVCVCAGKQEDINVYPLIQPYLFDSQHSPLLSLAAVAATCLGWQLATALVAYLTDTPFATERAVERYKALARIFRALPNPILSIERSDPAMLLLSRARQDSAASVAEAFVRASQQDAYYLDVTFNGELSPTLHAILTTYLRPIALQLDMAIKVRCAPAAYHVSEQAELDGPPVVSLRILMCDHPASLVGTYRANFLRAQALATWQAMRERDRPCFLLLVDEAAPGGAIVALEAFLQDLQGRIKNA